MCLYTTLINEPFELCSQMSIIHIQSHATYSCLLKLVYLCWTIQLANELIEYFNASWIFTHSLSVIIAI
jgi:hypothetical protein